MKQVIPTYTFSASGKTVTFTDFTTIRLDRVLLISNVTANLIIYNFADPTAGGTVATNVLTLAHDTTAMSNGDSLQIIYDCLTGDPDYQKPTVIAQDDLMATGTITTKNLNATSGVATAGSTIAIAGPMVGISTVSLQTTGTFTGVLTPQVSLDGANWVAMNTTSLINVTTGAYSATVPSAAQQIYQADIAGFAYFRLTALGTQTGTATVTLRATNATGLVGIDNPLPPGANSLGTVTVNGTVTANSNSYPKPATLVTGQVTSATTQVQFTATSRVPTQGVLVKANAGNATNCYVGVAGVTTTTGFELAPGQTVILYPANVNVLYVIGTTALDVVSWLMY
jgi:hypothetical protein